MEGLDKFFEKYEDELLDSQSVTQEVIDACKGKIPDEIIAIWNEHGFCGYAEGLFWTINPLEYKELLKNIVDSDDDIWPIMRTAFGDIIFVYMSSREAKYQFDVVDLKHHEIEVITFGVDSFIMEYLMHPGRIENTANIEFFDEPLDELGELKSDECYGFEPILALGGDEDEENIKKFNLKAHLAVLTQALEGPIGY